MSRVLPRVAAAWHSWLFTRGELFTLAIFRIGWSVAMLTMTLHDAGLAAMYTNERYHAPLFAWIAPPTPFVFRASMQIATIACLLTLIGLLPRLAAAVVVACHAYLFACDLLMFRNHAYLGLLLGLLLVASPCGHRLALDAVVRKRLGRPMASVGSRAAVQLIKVQVLIVYAWSVINKLRGSFLNGWALQSEIPYALRGSPIAPFLYTDHGSLRPAVAHLLANDRVMSACSYAVLAIEAFLVFGLPQRRWHRYAVGLGVALHAFILLSMNVITFGLLMVSSYPLFLPWGARQERQPLGKSGRGR